MESTILNDWLWQNVPGYDAVDLVTDHPWAQTHRVKSPNGLFFVKVLPRSQRDVLQSMELLSNRFSPRVPLVVAVCKERGYVLFRDHGGRPVHLSEEHDYSIELLKMYAQLQTEAIGQSELIAKMPKMQLDGLEDRFLDFFSLDANREGGVGASHFIGERKAKYYFDRLSLRISGLKPLFDAATALPKTINHCDLRPQNAAVRVDGSLVLFDWDDSIVGPAGMSLHNFFEGCSVPMSILRDRFAADEIEAGSLALMDCYLNTLEEGNYATRDQLKLGLPGSICAGVMRYIMSYGNFPTDDDDFRHVISKIIRRRTDDLLEGLDDLTIGERTEVMARVLDYESCDHADAAARLIEKYMQSASPDLEMQSRLASNLFQSGRVDEAEGVCRQCLDKAPMQPEMRFLLGHICLERLDLDSAMDQWALAQEFGFGSGNLSEWIEQVRQVRAAVKSASSPGSVPTITHSNKDDSVGTFARMRSRIATRLFQEYGTLLVENVFPPELLDSLHNEFSSRYWPQLQDGNPTAALEVGNRRFMVTLELDGPFNDSGLYADPFLISIFRRLLGDDFILGSFTAVTALPGAADMRMHKDHPALFDSKELGHSLPTFAVTVLIPLLGFDAEMGTTRIVKGSQRVSSVESAGMDFQDPLGPMGSCLLMDYRLSHQGLANRSNRVRPVLSLVYNRSWFRDSANYKSQRPLQMSRKELGRVSEESRPLFDWLFPEG